MAQPPNALTASYSRGREPDWIAAKRENHRRWRRRRLVIGSGTAAAVLVVAFIIYGYPRESGLTDALGLTCGEYVHVGDPSGVEPPFADWTAHQQALSADDDVDEQQLISAVETIGQHHDAQPVLGQFDAGGITERQHSAAAVGDKLLIGHHVEYWTGTDRVSVYDPAAEAITWTAQTIHPVRDYGLADEARQPVLYGVGTTESRLVLQTPTYHGDTDLVTAELGSEEDPECLRLDGAVETQQITGEYQGRATAWSQVINLNAARIGEHEFQIHHGLGEDAPEHQLSAVDVVTGSVEPAEPPVDIDSPHQPLDIPAAAQEQFDEGFESLATVGEDHLLLTWEAGSVILKRH